MSANLHLAKTDDLDRLLPLIRAYHAELGIDRTEDEVRAALAPLLDGAPIGVAYIIGPTRAPVGYIVITFGWSLAHGGMTGVVDELYIRPAVRGRGMASEVLRTLPKALAQGGLAALSVQLQNTDERAQRLYARARFQTVEGQQTLMRAL